MVEIEKKFIRLGVNTCCISSDDSFIISGSWDKTLKMWDLKTGNCLQTFVGHTSVVKTACLSNDNLFVISGSYDRSIQVWDISLGVSIQTWGGQENEFEEGHGAPITSCGIMHTDNSYIVSSSRDMTIRFMEFLTE